AVVVLVVLANDHLIMITAHFPLFFLKIRHFFYRYQLVDPKDPTYNNDHRIDIVVASCFTGITYCIPTRWNINIHPRRVIAKLQRTGVTIVDIYAR
ncbi:MAG: hypothetical protein ACRC5A_13425, partial [Enterobacteriaceae bacterium]